MQNFRLTDLTFWLTFTLNFSVLRDWSLRSFKFVSRIWCHCFLFKHAWPTSSHSSPLCSNHITSIELKLHCLSCSYWRSKALASRLTAIRSTFVGFVLVEYLISCYLGFVITSVIGFWVLQNKLRSISWVLLVALLNCPLRRSFQRSC